MKLIPALIASAALAASLGAQAAVFGSQGGGTGTFLTLDNAGLNGGTVAKLTGGTVLNSDQPFADIPKGVIFGGNFLSAGPTTGTTATLSFTGSGVDYISFLWGSPDTYNQLTVSSTGSADQTFVVGLLGLPGDGNQGVSSYVQFAGIAGSKITALTFTNLPSINAFETANFSVTAPVPEPETYALMLAGLGALGFIARRRKNA